MLYATMPTMQGQESIPSLPNPEPLPLTSVDLTLLQQGAAQIGVALSAAQLTQFEAYYQLLVEWNQKFNLTSIVEHNDVQSKHFLDSLVGLPVWAGELGESLPLQRPLRCVDVGSGAGFPGIPLKIAAPALSWTLMDGTGKKVTFLRHVIAALGLPDIEVVQGRAEELGRNSSYREQFDLVTARAVAPLNALVEYLLPLARRQGLVMIYKGAGVAEEFIAARKAISLLGGETVRMTPVQVPFLEEQRFIVLIRKVQATPNIYPRGQGLARKKPLG